jgi:hypothetical protein
MTLPEETGLFQNGVALQDTPAYYSFVNLGLWEDVRAFQEQIDRPYRQRGLAKLPFAYAKCQGLLLQPCQWRLGTASLPARDQLGTAEGHGDAHTCPSAESSDLFWHGQRRFRFTTIGSIDACGQLIRAQPAVRFRDRPLPLDPCRFDGIEPWACAGQRADDDTHPDRAPLALLLMLADPAPHRGAAVPGRVVPDHQPGREALGCEVGRAPRQTIHGHRTPRAPGDKAAPHLLRLRWPRSYQEPRARQGLGRRIVAGQGEVLYLLRGVCLGPGLLVGLGPPPPPAFVAQAQRPRRVGQRSLDQPSAPFFFGRRRDRDC